MKTEIHAVLFPKSRYTTEQARRELANMNLKARKRVHTTEDYHRYSITPAKKNGSYFSKKTPEKEIVIVFERK